MPCLAGLLYYKSVACLDWGADAPTLGQHSSRSHDASNRKRSLSTFGKSACPAFALGQGANAQLSLGSALTQATSQRLSVNNRKPPAGVRKRAGHLAHAPRLGQPLTEALFDLRPGERTDQSGDSDNSRTTVGLSSASQTLLYAAEPVVSLWGAIPVHR